ncbi:hypothetical protein [Aminobacter sp. AP02]|uniref:hypothetical protein n=1 Tax=Aminobacter sp. AP02 TaxID=2135737 RepID=UPI000D6B6521|nr:hypothetical protein [Aminobacter sp. AP02]PWK70793.1 hypothetical protein C8K44_107273 [Aminobacter sp. AP02]
MDGPADTKYCDDTVMAYEAARRVFLPGGALTFDAAYRLAHLPLVSPGHPDAIASKEGTDYLDGRYEIARHSLVLPIDAGELARSEVFGAFERELRAFSFSDKIEWTLSQQRASKLHATIVNGLAEPEFGRCADAAATVLRSTRGFSVRIGGPFLGEFNTGRIYFPVYPEQRGGNDIFALIQDACGAMQTRLYLIGYYHFASSLTPAETDELAGLVEQWRHRVLAHLAVKSLAIQSTNDDLALSARIVSTIPVGDRQP